MADIVAGIGTPVPCNATRDPAALNVGFSVYPLNHINAGNSARGVGYHILVELLAAWA